MFSPTTLTAISSGLQIGGMLGSTASGIMQAVYARREASYAQKQAEYAAKATRRQAEIQAYQMQSQALDNLALADFTAGQTLLEAQQAEDIGTMRANIPARKGAELGAP